VFASIGPSGKMLAADEVTEADLCAAFSEQARELAAAGADALLVETMSDLDEAVIAVTAARATGLPVIASVVFDSGRNKDRTMMGNTPEQCAQRLEEAGADAIGANCGRGIAGYIEICRRLRAATSHPIWIKANAGMPELVDGNAVYTTSPEEFAAHVPALIEAGATFVGGCCGTTPAFIRAVKEKVLPCASA
jgi:5-methyltetrahydrofolate--homocysteine methyltransferase